MHQNSISAYALRALLPLLIVVAGCGDEKAAGPGPANKSTSGEARPPDDKKTGGEQKSDVAKGDTHADRKKDDLPKDSPKVEAKKDDRPPFNPSNAIYPRDTHKGDATKAKPPTDKPAYAPSADTSKDGPAPDVITAEIPRFPFPPPKPSAKMVLPAKLVHKAGTRESLLDVGQRLDSALDIAGYVERSYFAVPQGFAIATRLEQFDADGTPLPPPNRWSAAVAQPRVFSISSYMKALFSAHPGHFRVVVLVVTSKSFSTNDKVEVSRDQALSWVSTGGVKLPKVYGQFAYTDDYACTALVYEFEKLPDDDPVLKDPGLDARTHLEKAKLMKGLGE